MSEDSMYKMAEQRADDKISFQRHLISYVSVNLFLFVINFILSPHEWWFMWVSLFWGIGLLIHFLKAYVLYDKFDGKYRDDMIENELEKMKK